VFASLVLLGMMLLLLGASPDQTYGGTKLQLYVAQVLVFLFGAIFVGTRQRETRLFVSATWLIASAGALLFTFYLVTGATHATVGGRYSLSAQEYPIELGRDSADGLLIAIYAVIAAQSRRARLWAMSVIPVLAVAMLAAGSRGPVLAFVFGLGSLLALTATDPRARRRLALVAAVFVVAALVVPLVVPGSALGRALSAIIGSASGLSSNGRSDLWNVALSSFSAHPLLGIGTGGFAGLNTGLLYPHNILLECATEFGVVGAVAILAVIVGMLSRLTAVWRMTRSTERLLAALLIALFLTALVNACFSGAIQDNRELWIWGGLAIGMSVRIANRAWEQPTDPDRAQRL
jgi:O-antigen ligase